MMLACLCEIKMLLKRISKDPVVCTGRSLILKSREVKQNGRGKGEAGHGIGNVLKSEVLSKYSLAK